MLKILIGFLPWILYFILHGSTKQQHEIAILIAIMATILFDFHSIKKGFILSWGTLLFFLLFYAAIFYLPFAILDTYANLLANSALALIVWVSILIKKPFTLQYARLTVAEKYWHSPIFLRINYFITLVWGVCFLLAILVNIIQFYFPKINFWFYQLLSYLPTIVAIYFTKIFPNWYQKHYENKEI